MNASIIAGMVPGIIVGQVVAGDAPPQGFKNGFQKVIAGFANGVLAAGHVLGDCSCGCQKEKAHPQGFDGALALNMLNGEAAPLTAGWRDGASAWLCHSVAAAIEAWLHSMAASVALRQKRN